MTTKSVTKNTRPPAKPAMEFVELRKRTGMGQGEAAAYIGVTRKALEHWEQRRRTVPQYAINALLRAVKE